MILKYIIIPCLFVVCFFSAEGVSSLESQSDSSRIILTDSRQFVLLSIIHSKFVPFGACIWDDQRYSWDMDAVVVQNAPCCSK